MNETHDFTIRTHRLLKCSWPKVFRNYVFSLRRLDMALSQLQEVTAVVAESCNKQLIFRKTNL